MSSLVRVLAAVAVVTAASLGCAPERADTGVGDGQTDTTMQQPGSETMATETRAPGELTDSIITMGSRLAESGTEVVAAEGDSFQMGEPLFIAVRTEGQPAGTAVALKVTGPGSTSVADLAGQAPERGEYTIFEIEGAEQWKAGSYRVEATVGGESVEPRTFSLVEKPAV